MLPAIDTDPLAKFAQGAKRAQEIIARINKRLKDAQRTSPQFSMLDFLSSQAEIRDQLAEAKEPAERLRTSSGSEYGEEQRSGDALIVRRATLAILLEVSRLAGMLEALL